MSIRTRIAGDPRQIDHLAARLEKEGLDAWMAGDRPTPKALSQAEVSPVAAATVEEDL